jgi:hypothetical protein
METIENTQIKAISEGLLDQYHQGKRHKVFIRDIQQESLKETPPKLLHENSSKNTSENVQKEKHTELKNLSED